MKTQPPEISYHFAYLSSTKLHYLKCGDGPPLIMFPATISELKNWLDLAQFIGQRFTVYFFELPGHGKSIAFKKRFKSELVAKTVEEFIEHLGYNKVNIMGFSFGGILTMKTMFRIYKKVDKLILLAPCVTNRALLHSKPQLNIMKKIVKIMRLKSAQKVLLSLMHNRITIYFIMWFLRYVGNIKNLKGLDKKLLTLPLSTLDVLVYQLNEILTIEFPKRRPFRQKLYFSMSINDNLIDFNITKMTLQKYFKDMIIQEFDLPYHQPPQPFTFDELNELFGKFLEKID